MTVARGVLLTAGSGVFRWSLEKGTATLRPPAPFTGSATFTRHGNDGKSSELGTRGRMGTRQDESGTRLSRLGAEQSQVQILSPR